MESSQGSTIVVDPGPQKCCSRCLMCFPETDFKALKNGRLSAECIVCIGKRTATAKMSKSLPLVQETKQARNRKRKVLGEVDGNASRKAPRLAPKEPVRWDMASQFTREQMRPEAARERENRYRRNNSLSPIPTPSLRIDLPEFSSILFPSRTPPPPTPPPEIQLYLKNGS